MIPLDIITDPWADNVPLTIEQLQKIKKSFEQMYNDPVRQALKAPVTGQQIEVWIRQQAEDLERMVKDEMDTAMGRIGMVNRDSMTNLFKEVRLELAVIQDQITELFELLSDE